MTRKYVDCREAPSVSGCSLVMIGEEEELVRAAAVHAADVHEHEDTPELREMIRGELHDLSAGEAGPGAFIQLIEFHTDRIDEVDATMDEWAGAGGANRAARWVLNSEDHDHPHEYVQIVQFPDYPEAMRNSANPMTTRFAERMQKLCDGPARFTNLDVRRTLTF